MRRGARARRKGVSAKAAGSNSSSGGGGGGGGQTAAATAFHAFGRQQKRGRCLVDFTKLKHHTLRRYVEAYALKTVHLYSSKDDLCRAVEEHFTAQIVTEKDVVMSFIKKEGAARGQSME